MGRLLAGLLVLVALLACAPAWAQGTATLLGTVQRPVGPEQMRPLEGSEVYLRDMERGETIQVRTGVKGVFRFEDLRPGVLYYVVVISHLRVEDANPRLQAVPSGNGTVIWRPDLSVRVLDWAVSWHQAVTIERPGTWRIDLTPYNADAEFCGDLKPTYDAISRAPYASWRRASLQEVR